MTKNKIVMFITIFSILSLVLAGTYAYWQYRGANKNFSLVVSGIDESQINYSGNSAIVGNFLPVSTFCESSSTTISFSKDSSANNVELVADMYMDINAIGTNMVASEDIYWIITEGDNTISCDEGLSSTAILNYGDFMGAEVNDQITLLEDIAVGTGTKTFTVWIWIDSAASNLSDFSGETIDVSVWTNMTAIGVAPNAPVLDDGMIPVTISSDGTVTTVSEDDPNWYDYSNKEWANIVLVNTDATEGVDGSYSRQDYLDNLSNNVEVNESDILAYYVWIPRYKYRIPYKKCSDIPESERNMEDYPECYAPYSMSEDDLNVAALGLADELYLLQDITSDINKALEIMENALLTGKILHHSASKKSIVSWINYYNIKEEIELSLISSTFNENNTLLGDGNEVSIDIVFETKEDTISYGNATNTYYSHPAFIWDGETLPGIWVGKFETSPDLSSDCHTTASSNNCNNTTQNPRIIPDVLSLSYQDIGNQFKTSLNFANGTMSDSDGTVTFAVDENNIYGLNTTSNKTDSHMMKNSEWGAVAYLSHSKYGINSEVYINNSDKDITGRSGGNVSGSVKPLKEQFTDATSSLPGNAYGYYTWLGEAISIDGEIGSITDSTLGTKASTTGNVTGIYDMSGGAHERVMGYYSAGSDSTTFPLLLESKYYDIYLETEFNSIFKMPLCTLENCGGHAMLETYNWYNNYTGFISDDPWFARGVNATNYYSAGVFAVAVTDSDSYTNGSWRSVLVVDN